VFLNYLVDFIKVEDKIDPKIEMSPDGQHPLVMPVVTDELNPIPASGEQSIVKLTPKNILYGSRTANKVVIDMLKNSNALISAS
jgi:hypothetical protein